MQGLARHHIGSKPKENQFKDCKEFAGRDSRSVLLRLAWSGLCASGSLALKAMGLAIDGCGNSVGPGLLYLLQIGTGGATVWALERAGKSQQLAACDAPRGGFGGQP